MAFDYRYSSDVLPWVLLGGAIALVGVARSPWARLDIDGSAHLRVRDPPVETTVSMTAERRRAMPFVLGGVIAATVAYSATSLISTVRYRNAWDAAVSRSYWSNLRTDAAKLNAIGKPWSLYDTAVPDTVPCLQITQMTWSVPRPA